MRQSLSHHPQTTRHCNKEGAFHLHLGGLDAVFLTAKPANFLGKAWMKVLEHKPPVPGFGGDVGSSSRKAQCSAVPGRCLDGAGRFACCHACCLRQPSPASVASLLSGCIGSNCGVRQGKIILACQRVWLSVNVVPVTCQGKWLF